MKLVLSTLVLVLLLAAGLLLINFGAVHGESPIATAHPGSPRPLHNANLATVIVEPPRDPAVEAARESLDIALEPLHIHGVVIVEELDGTESSGANGTLDLILWRGRNGLNYTVEVTNGCWSADLVPDAEGGYTDANGLFQFPADIAGAPISFGLPELADGKTSTRVVDATQRTSFGAEDVIVKLLRRAPFTLEVVAAEDGSPLSNVTVLLHDGKRWIDTTLLQNPALRMIASELPSPIELEPKSNTALRSGESWLVGSPGYGWEPISLHLNEGGRQRIELYREGDLQVLLQGAALPNATELRLREKHDSRPLAAVPANESPSALFQDLPPGEYTVSLELGDWWRTNEVFATADAFVKSDRLTQVTLSFETPLSQALAPVFGLLVLPTEWKATDFQLELRAQVAPEAGAHRATALHANQLEEVEPGLFLFNFGWKQVGLYTLGLSEPNYAMEFELFAEPQIELTFEIPKPVRVSVLVRDAATGEVAEEAGLHWTAGHCGGNSELRFPDEDRFQIQVPRGEITLTSGGGMGSEYVTNSITFQAREGLEVALDLQRSCAAKITLRDSETGSVLSNLPFSYELYAIGTSTKPIEGFTCSGIGIESPGTYRLELELGSRYEAVDPIEIEFVPGETRQVEIQLVESK